MRNKSYPVMAFLGLNLLAAYAPSLLCLPKLAGTGSTFWTLLLFPVLLAEILLWATNTLVALSVLSAFVAALALVSCAFCRTKKAWVVTPGIVALYSLLQGLMAATIIDGIDAIGHS